MRPVCHAIAVSDLNPYLEIMPLIAASIAGALSGAFAANKLTESRERENERRNRKRKFRAFVVQFRSEAADRYHPDIKHFVMFYRDKIPNLRHAAATIRDDFPRGQRAKFDKLVSTAAAGFTGAQADGGGTGKQRIFESLDAILRFLDA